MAWYENHEDRFTSWDRLVEEIKSCFGDAIAKMMRATEALPQRAQVPGETRSTYTEEVLRLCKVVNSVMTDEDKLGHVFMAIVEDIHNFLIAQEGLDSTVHVIGHCHTSGTFKTRRIIPTFGRLAHVTTLASVDGSEAVDLGKSVRRIVR